MQRALLAKCVAEGPADAGPALLLAKVARLADGHGCFTYLAVVLRSQKSMTWLSDLDPPIVLGKVSARFFHPVLALASRCKTTSRLIGPDAPLRNTRIHGCPQP